MSAKTIVVTNRKGGVGKTTVSVHLATGLTLAGYRVGMIDTDAQGHVAVYFGMKKEDGLYRMFSGDSTLSAELRIVPRDTYVANEEMNADVVQDLYILPGAKQTSSIATGEGYDATYFREICDDMSDMLNLDYIIVDTGPTANLFDGAVNFAANYMLYVTEATSLSFDGLRASMAELEKTTARQNKYRAHKAEVLGIVVNKWRGNTAIQRHQIETLNKAFPTLVNAPLPQATVWQEACDFNRAVFAFDHNSKEAQKMWALIKQVVGRVEAHNG